MSRDRKLLRRQGSYTDIGPIIIPSTPQLIILTDRQDGSKWQLTFNAGLPVRVSITSLPSAIQALEGARVYDINDGPKMDEDGEFTIILRGGRLGIDYTAFPRGTIARDDPPPYARSTVSRSSVAMMIDNTDPALKTTHLGVRF